MPLTVRKSLPPHREQPRVWLPRNAEERGLLEWHKTKGHIDGYEIVAD